MKFNAYRPVTTFIGIGIGFLIVLISAIALISQISWSNLGIGVIIPGVITLFFYT
ncbi:MAG: hypothetical protein HC811_14100 [Flammeovirgaceae bacterium]|nr:hypothetical protein [Flammeovirgaceae bacterium]